MKLLRALPLRSLVPVCLLASIAACGGSPSPATPTPTQPVPPVDPGPVTSPLTAQVVSAVGSQQALSGVTVTATGVGDAVTDATGFFTLRTASPAAYYPLVLQKSGFVDRKTRAQIPGSAAVLSMIPSDFNLEAFEEFAPRAYGLRKWRTNPFLLIYTHWAEYPSTKIDERELSTASVDCLSATMQAAIADMTGGALAFSRVQIDSGQPGSTVPTPDGAITVFCAKNLDVNGRAMAYTGSQPYSFGRGTVWFNSWIQPCDASPQVRTILTHELGHALGYAFNHVFKAPSIMSGSAPTSTLTQFDRDAIAIIYHRPPGNLAPDTDPSDYSINMRAALPPTISSLFLQKTAAGGDR